MDIEDDENDLKNVMVMIVVLNRDNFIKGIVVGGDTGIVHLIETNDNRIPCTWRLQSTNKRRKSPS